MYLNMELAVFNYHSMERFAAAAVMTTVDLCNDTTAGARQITFLHSKSRKKSLNYIVQSNINFLLLGHNSSKQILA